jgi:hypothetical protein
MAAIEYHIYAQANVGNDPPSAILSKVVAPAAHYFGFTRHPTKANEKPVFTAAPAFVMDYTNGLHRLYLVVGDHKHVVSYVTVNINHFNSLSGHTPAEIVASALDVEVKDVTLQNPKVGAIAFTVTATDWTRRWLASDLLPALVYYVKAHGGVILGSNNTSHSSRYSKYFGSWMIYSAPSVTGSWIGINM